MLLLATNLFGSERDTIFQFIRVRSQLRVCLFQVLLQPLYPFENIKRAAHQKSADFSDLTFSSVNEKIRSVSAGLLRLGVEKGDHIGLIADVGHRWMWCSMGITSIGCVDVPRGTDATREDLGYIFEHAGCPIIFLEHTKVFETVKPILAGLPRLRTVVLFQKDSAVQAGELEILSLDELMDRGQRLLEQDRALIESRVAGVQEDDLATIIYTSGTTGTPKGVMLTHRNLAWEARTVLEVLGKDGNPISTQDRTLGFLPPWHIGQRIFETIMFLAGASISFTAVTSLAQDLRKIKPTLMFSVPRVWESFYNKMLEGVRDASGLQQRIFHFARAIALKSSWHRANARGRVYRLYRPSAVGSFFSRLFSAFMVVLLAPLHAFAYMIFGKVRAILGGHIRFAISGAGALPEHIDRLFAAVGIPILEAYGMTETTGVSTARLLGQHVIGTVGKPVGGIEVRLVDEKGQAITEPGVKGVAHHRGNNIMLGYYREPEKTRATIDSEGWLNSGDLMVWTDRGFLKFAGRAKDTIVLLGGENLEPEPIEFALLQSPYVHQVIVVGQDRKTLGALIVPDAARVEEHLATLGEAGKVSVNDYNENLFRKEVRQRISADNGFKNFERVTTYHLLPNEFKVGDELTQTMKMKRNVVFDKYAAEIDRMYS